MIISSLIIFHNHSSFKPHLIFQNKNFIQILYSIHSTLQSQPISTELAPSALHRPHNTSPIYETHLQLCGMKKPDDRLLGIGIEEPVLRQCVEHIAQKLLPLNRTRRRRCHRLLLVASKRLSWPFFSRRLIHSLALARLVYISQQPRGKSSSRVH